MSNVRFEHDHIHLPEPRRQSRLRLVSRLAVPCVAIALSACTRGETAAANDASTNAASADSVAQSGSPAPDSRFPIPDSRLASADTALSTGVGSLRGSIDSALAATQRRVRPRARARPRTLPPLADSIADKLVFPPVTQSWFLAAARGKRMLVDIGRVDTEVRRDPARLAAYKLAVDARSPIPPGTRFRLRGSWGADDAVVKDFDTWNGRIVATLETSARVDSMAKVIEPLPATAQLVDSAAESIDKEAGCARGPLSAALEARVMFVRDSLDLGLRATERPPYERLMKSLKSRSTHAVGCFPGGPVIVITTLWAGEYEWVREVVLLLDNAGKPTPLRLRDYRFRGHEALFAMDGDGDGIDDLATRGYGPNLGGTSVLRIVDGLKPKDPRRLERMATGFGWENR